MKPVPGWGERLPGQPERLWLKLSLDPLHRKRGVKGQSRVQFLMLSPKVASRWEVLPTESVSVELRDGCAFP